MATNKKLAACVAALCEAFNRQPTAATFKAYELGLSGVKDAALDVATLAVLQSAEYKFMPSPGELRALAVTGGMGVNAQADGAWRSLNRAIDSYGYTTSINFRDGLINATVRQLGGLDRCCTMLKEEFDKWYSRDFRTTYIRFLMNGCPSDAIGYLPGQCERENTSWIGQEYGKGGKPYELPTPADIPCDYTPLIESPPAKKQLESRPTDVPRIAFKRA